MLPIKVDTPESFSLFFLDGRYYSLSRGRRKRQALAEMNRGWIQEPTKATRMHPKNHKAEVFTRLP